MSQWQPTQTPQVQAMSPMPETYTCEQCGARQPAETAHSHIIGVYHWNNELGYQAAQCDDTQHFACNNEHALILGHDCIDNHMPVMTNVPYEKSPLPPLPTRCSLVGCGRALNTDWWQVAPTYAMRGAQGLEGHAYWDLPEFRGNQTWYCTLEHAATGGHVLLEKLNDLGYEDNEPIPANIAPARRIVAPKG